jgi:hypothetical protein
MIAHGERGVNVGLGPGRCGREADRSGEIAGNPTDLSVGGGKDHEKYSLPALAASKTS